MKTTFIVLSLCLFSLSSFANDGKCRDEVKKLCPHMKFGKEMVKCIQENKDKFSDECKERGAKAKEKFKEVVADCKGDVQNFCKDVEHGEGRLAKCLKANAEKLSPACKSHMKI